MLDDRYNNIISRLIICSCVLMLLLSSCMYYQNISSAVDLIGHITFCTYSLVTDVYDDVSYIVIYYRQLIELYIHDDIINDQVRYSMIQRNSVDP
jgi:hypothetical protein